jgi:hypothetical protein
MGDGLEGGHTKSLDQAHPHKLAAIQALENAAGFSNCPSEPVDEHPAGKRPSVRKLLITLTPVRLASQA